MSLGYSNLEEVLAVIQGQLVVDLVDHTAHVDQNFLETLRPPKQGYYMPGAITPYLSRDVSYGYREVRHQPSGPDGAMVTDWVHHPFEIFGDVDIRTIALPGDLVTNREGPVIRRQHWPHLRKLLRDQPDVPAQACMAGIGVVLQYLNNLSSYARVMQGPYNLYSLVKPEYQDEIEGDYFQNTFKSLLAQVQSFVGNDTWNYYTYRVSGSSLIIVKGIDVRIYEWYRTKFDELETRNERGIDDPVSLDDLHDNRIF